MDAKCTAYCNYGYAGKPTSLSCRVKGDVGSWVGPFPACEEIKCAPPAAVNHTEFEGCKDLKNGESCIASCKHKFKGKSTTLTCEVEKFTGRIAGPLPSCDPVLCELPQDDNSKGINFIDCHGLANGETCTAKCKPWRGYKGDDSQPECKIDENNVGFFDSLPDCQIRKTWAGSHCYFPVWYKDTLMIDDCTSVEWHTEWCFIDPRTGYWGECDPKTKIWKDIDYLGQQKQSYNPYKGANGDGTMMSNAVSTAAHAATKGLMQQQHLEAQQAVAQIFAAATQ